MNKILMIFVLFTLLFSLSALDINNPNDTLYTDLEYWQERGYFRHLPMIRPYPTQLLIPLLEKVIERGRPEDKETASFYLQEINQPLRLDIALQSEAALKLDDDYWFYGGFLVGINGVIRDDLTIWSSVGGNLILNQEFPYYMDYSFLPYGERTNKDFVDDTAYLGPFEMLQGLNATMAYGTENLYFLSGVNRTSFGPFYRDGIILSPEAPQAGHFQLTWFEDNFSYSMLMLQLVATDCMGDEEETGKYYFMHSYNWSPFDWLDIGFVETIVGSMQAVYLLPFGELFYNQGMYGFDDNSQMGLVMRSRLPYDLELSAAGFLDDISFNDYLRFNFDSKLKLALQGGISWSPGEEWLRKASFDYTLVTPYMYTHEQYVSRNTTDVNAINMTNYTHRGENLGTTLNPNSDRIYGQLQWRPLEMTDIFLFGSYMRHANGSVDGSTNVADPERDNAHDSESDNSNETIIHDGSIFDGGIADDGTRTFENANRLFQQDVVEQVFQLGFGMDTDLAMPFMDPSEYYRMKLSLDYVFEMVWNSSLNSDYGFEPVKGDDHINQYLSVNIIFQW